MSDWTIPLSDAPKIMTSSLCWNPLYDSGLEHLSSIHHPGIRLGKTEQTAEES
jgi:hypothetical protein